tara:strand:+ start:525 stop:677 length:153 start_codon:yes stop_codon:yes gene_type:complete
MLHFEDWLKRNYNIVDVNELSAEDFSDFMETYSGEVVEKATELYYEERNA